MSVLLALDASTGPASIAILRGGKLLAAHEDADAHAQSQKLVRNINALVHESVGGYAALDKVVVTTGPGGFTGIRIALAAARGFALAAGKPLAGISTLETYAWQALYDKRENNCALALVNAFRGQVYVQAFCRKGGGMEPLQNAQTLDISDVERWKGNFPGAVSIGNVEDISDICSQPQALYAGLYALTQNPLESLPVEAFYIRSPDAKPQKPLLET